MIVYAYGKVNIPKSIRCDICGAVYSYDQDFLETQEFTCLDFTGGYGSVFGDQSNIKCDICQHCLIKMLKKKYRIV
jgi:hypothetical protein